MTVQTLLSINDSNEPEDLAELDRLCQKVKEVTQETDDKIVKEALKKHKIELKDKSKSPAYRYDISEAIAEVLESKNANTKLRLTRKTASPVAGAFSNSWQVGSEGSDDLAKAIAASLEESKEPPGANKGPTIRSSAVGLGGQVTAEDQELSKVIEASLAESQSSQAGYSALFFTDPINPHERERNGLWPVGLKNVGNTCWFNVVIQALFHVPAFRQQVLDFHYVQNSSASANEYKGGFSAYAPLAPKELQFMSEMRKLFALLIYSKRKYVDPTGVIDVLRRNDDQHKWNSGTLDSQQDVSEFTHLVLQWLEDAFALQTKNDKENRSEDAPEANHTINPMLELFYGSYAVESPSTPVETQREKFSQYVVQVSDFDNLHDSLEASVSAIRSEDGVGPTPPANCHWFTHLPPVMLFELSRFQYNKVDNRAEKIHQRFNFPELLYMDRYLRANKDLVKEKRVKVQQLRSQLKTLKDQLATYQSFGSGVVKLPISDILTYTLEFSESYKKLSMDKCDSADINGNPAEETLPRRGSQPTRSASPMDFASASAEESKLVMVDAAMECCETVGIPEVNSTTLPMIDAEMTEGSSLNADAAMVTSDSDAFTEERELVLVRRWLKRWRENVLMEVQKLENEIRTVEEAIRSIYECESLAKHGYRLHSVMVHEGQATSGHYWAFLNCPTSQTWLKFNDIQVTKVSWEEVQKDSFGGHHNASAYCLVYANIGRTDLFDDFSHSLDVESRLVSLSEALRHHVQEHNEAFTQELAQWELKASSVPVSTLPQTMETEAENWDEPPSVGPQLPSARPAATAPMAILSSVPRERRVSSSASANSVDPKLELPGQTLEKEIDPVAHIRLGLPLTRECLNFVLKNVDVSGHYDPVRILESAIEEEFQRVSDKVKRFVDASYDPLLECRLNHVLAFLLMAKHLYTERLAKFLLLQHHLALELHTDVEKRLKAAASEMASHMQLTPEEMSSYNLLHVEYLSFLKSLMLFLSITDHYNKAKYEAALKLCFCYETAYKGSINNGRLIQPELLRLYQRTITEKYSTELSIRLMSGQEENLDKINQEVKSTLLPSLSMLMRSNPPDSAFFSNVQFPWLELICQMTASNSIKTTNVLQEIVSLLMDSEGCQAFHMPKLSAKVKAVPSDVAQKYKNFLNQATESDMWDIFKKEQNPPQ